jgi:hypothetical protein
MAVAADALALDSGLQLRPLDEDEIRLILRKHPKISRHISEAVFTRVHQRELTAARFNDLKGQACPAGDCSSWEARIAARESRLAPYVGKSLVCVFVRFPNVHFTVEIDPIRMEVVHFEGQAS